MATVNDNDKDAHICGVQRPATSPAGASAAGLETEVAGLLLRCADDATLLRAALKALALSSTATAASGAHGDAAALLALPREARAALLRAAALALLAHCAEEPEALTTACGRTLLLLFVEAVDGPLAVPTRAPTLATLLVAALRRLAGAPVLRDAACAVLAQAFGGAPAALARARAAGAVGAVIAELECATRTARAPHGGLAALAALLEGASPAELVRARAAGAAPAVVAAMLAVSKVGASHAQAAQQAQAHGCACLTHLTACAPRLEAALPARDAAAGVRAALAALSAHARSPGVQRAALHAIARLWPSAHADPHARGARGATAAAIAAAMGTHDAKHAAVQVEGCVALANIALGGGSRPQSSSSSSLRGDAPYDACASLRAVLRALRAHPAHAGVQAKGVRALRVLLLCGATEQQQLLRGSICAHALRLGAVADVSAAALVLRATPALRDAAASVLASLFSAMQQQKATLLVLPPPPPPPPTGQLLLLQAPQCCGGAVKFAVASMAAAAASMPAAQQQPQSRPQQRRRRPRPQRRSSVSAPASAAPPAAVTAHEFERPSTAAAAQTPTGCAGRQRVRRLAQCDPLRFSADAFSQGELHCFPATGAALLLRFDDEFESQQQQAEQ
jgi:hypothetical protein